MKEMLFSITTKLSCPAWTSREASNKSIEVKYTLEEEKRGKMELGKKKGCLWKFYLKCYSHAQIGFLHCEIPLSEHEKEFMLD